MAAVPALGPPPQSPEVLKPILTPACLNQWSKREADLIPRIGKAERELPSSLSAESVQGLTDLRWSPTNLSVPLSAYLQLSLTGKGNNDKCSAPPASTGSFRHWLNPKFALTLVYLVCLPWGPRGHALPQLERRRGKGIQYHLAELRCSLGPRGTMGSFINWSPAAAKPCCPQKHKTPQPYLRKENSGEHASHGQRSVHRTHSPEPLQPRVACWQLCGGFSHTKNNFWKQDRAFCPKKEGRPTSPLLVLTLFSFSASKQGPKPPPRSAGQLQAGGRRGWTLLSCCKSGTSNLHCSPTCRIHPLSRQLHCLHTAPFSSSSAYCTSLYPIVCVLPYSPRCLSISCVQNRSQIRSWFFFIIIFKIGRGTPGKMQ